MVSRAIYDRGKEMVGVFIKNELTLIFKEEAIPAIKELIMESYKNNLNGVVQGDYDSLKPETMEPLFEERLNNFEFIKDIGDGIGLTCPSVENFNFEDGLNLVGAMVNGIAADYYKIKATDYAKFASSDVVSMYGTKDYLVNSENPFLSNFNKDALDKFEFSMSPPIDIMGPALNYVKGNMPIWIRRAIRKAEINYKEFIQGAKPNAKHV